MVVFNLFTSTQVTYMLEGSFQHEDFCGHKGTINPGDLQVSNHFFPENRKYGRTPSADDR